MSRLRFLCLICVAAPLGCATAAGTTSHESRQAEDQHSSPAPAAPAEVPASDPVRASAIANGAALDRAVFVRSVLRANPSVESARQGWRAAIARVRRAGAFEDPMIDLGVAPLSIGSSKASFGYEVGISQRLPWFGKRSLEASAASAEASASRYDLETLRRELALMAVGLYGQYFVAVRSLEINAEHLELLRAVRAGATAQFESGRGAAQDPLQAESELARLERDTAVMASRRDVVVAQMNELLHRDPDAPLPPPPKELSLAYDLEGRDSKRLQSEAMAERQDIAALRQRARAEQSRSERAARDYYPDLTVSTSYNSMWDMPEHRWMVGLGFNLPIQTGARAGAADEAKALRARLESDTSRLEAAARTQVFVALRQLEESRQVLMLFEERLLPVARDQIDAARAGFTVSRNTFMAVIDAERSLRGVELDYQMARADCDRRHAELENALGRIPGLDAKGGPR